MFSEYHFSDMEIYHITNFTRITRILLSILLILLISSFRGKSSTRLGGNRSVIRGEGNLGGVRVGLGHRFAAAWVRVRAAFGDG